MSQRLEGWQLGREGDRSSSLQPRPPPCPQAVLVQKSAHMQHTHTYALNSTCTPPPLRHIHSHTQTNITHSCRKHTCTSQGHRLVHTYIPSQRNTSSLPSLHPKHTHVLRCSTCTLSLLQPICYIQLHLHAEKGHTWSSPNHT